MSETTNEDAKQSAAQKIFAKTKGYSAQFVLHASILTALAYAFSTGSIDGNFFQVFGLGVGVNLLSDLINRLARGDKDSDEAVKQIVENALAQSDLESLLTQEAFRRDMAWLLARHENLLTRLIQTSEQTITQTLLDQLQKNHLLNAAGLKAIYDRLGQIDAKSDQQHEEIMTWLRHRLPARRSIPLQRPERAVHFTGREEILAELRTALQPGEVVTLCGTGGLGKTALAAELIWQLAPEDGPPINFPDGIIYHNFYNQPQADIALEAIALTLGDEPRPTPEVGARRALAGKQLLIFLDGVEQSNDWHRILALRDRCAILVTSRKRSDARNQRLDLPPLNEADSVTLLQAWHQGIGQTTAEKICNLVGCLPLAIRLVGRYLNSAGESPQEYLTWLYQTPLEALDHEQRREGSVPYLLSRSLAQLSESAQEIMAVVGLLALSPFTPAEVNAALSLPTNQVWRALGQLVDYGLLLRTDEGYQVAHALIHTYVRRRLKAKDAILQKLAAYFTETASQLRDQGLAGYSQLNVLHPHIISIVQHCLNQQLWPQVRQLIWPINNYLSVMGHYSTLVRLYHMGIEAAQSERDPYDEAAFIGNLGITYRILGQVKRAIDHHNQALIISREIGYRQGEAAQLGNLGLAYRDLGQMKQAIDYHNQALIISREIGLRQSEASDLGNLGSVYRDLGQVKRAIDHHNQALIISREIGYRQGEAAQLGNLGLAYSDLGQVEQAINFHKQALLIHREIGYRHGEATQLSNLGACHGAMHQLEQANAYIQQALDIHREIGDRQGEATDLGNLGIAFRLLGDTEQAISYHQQSLDTNRGIDYRQGEAQQLSNLGSTYHTIGEVRQAFNYFREALRIYQEIGHRRGEGTELSNLGVVFGVLGQIEQAIVYFQHALSIQQEIGDRQGQAAQLGNLGNTYRANRQLKQAVDYYHNALDIHQETGNHEGQAISFSNLGLAHSDMGQVEQAIDYFTQSLDIFEAIKSPTAELVRKWLHQLQEEE